MATEPRVGGATSVANDAAHCAWNVFQKFKRSGTTPIRATVAAMYVPNDAPIPTSIHVGLAELKRCTKSTDAS